MPKKSKKQTILSTEPQARKVMQQIQSTLPGKHNNVQERVQEYKESRVDPAMLKTKEEGEAELEALREKQRKRKAK